MRNLVYNKERESPIFKGLPFLFFVRFFLSEFVVEAK